MPDRFQAYGAQHITALVIFAVGLFFVIALGRHVAGTPREQVVNRVFSVGILAFTIPMQILQFLPGEWDFNTSLPLQLCDFAWMIAAYALWTSNRLAVTITYLWGITLTTQAMITPDLISPFPEPRFLMFWLMHWLIVWSSFYVVFGLRILPTWRTYVQTVAITLVWMVCAIIFNTVFDTNYGYLNAKPAKGSALDLLPPWPWYLAVQIVVISSVWALMVWPWTRKGARDAGKSVDQGA